MAFSASFYSTNTCGSRLAGITLLRSVAPVAATDPMSRLEIFPRLCASRVSKMLKRNQAFSHFFKLDFVPISLPMT